MKDHNAPSPAKKLSDNSPKLNSTFQAFGFFKKKDASEYNITDDEFRFVSEYDGDPIVPQTSQDLIKENDLQNY